jgi:hypothetical protein
MRWRHLLTIASACSMVLWILVVILWVRSHFVADVYYRGYVIRTEAPVVEHHWFTSARGGLSYSRDIDLSQTNAGALFWWECQTRAQRGWSTQDAKPSEPSRGSRGWRVGGIGYTRMEVRHRLMGLIGHTQLFEVPHWLVALMAAVLPGIDAARIFRRRHRRAQKLCFSCGYDLRATPEQCPECGHEAAKVECQV